MAEEDPLVVIPAGNVESPIYEFVELSFVFELEMTADDIQSKEENGNPTNMSKSLHMHRLLFEKASPVFRATLKPEWSRTKSIGYTFLDSQRCQVQDFVRWSYCGLTNDIPNWTKLISACIFADEYQILSYSNDLKSHMKFHCAQWKPTLGEVKKVFKLTRPAFWLRKLAIARLVEARSTLKHADAKEWSACGIEMLVSFSMAVSQHQGMVTFIDDNRISEDRNSTDLDSEGSDQLQIQISSDSCKIVSDFAHVVRFTVQEYNVSGILHSQLLARDTKSAPQGLASSLTSTSTVPVLFFDHFCSWLYSTPPHARRRLSELQIDELLIIYKTCIKIPSSSTFIPLGFDQHIETLKNHLLLQVVRFKDLVFETINQAWCRQKELPSNEIIAIVYSITISSTDPLRELLQDIYLWHGSGNVLDIQHKDFQIEVDKARTKLLSKWKDYFKDMKLVECKRKSSKWGYHNIGKQEIPRSPFADDGGDEKADFC